MMLEGKEDLYEYGCYCTTNLAKACVSMIDNNRNNNKLLQFADISLSGKLINHQYSLSNDNFLEQINCAAGSLEVICQAINLVVGKNYQYDFINSFVDYFVYMIDVHSANIDKFQNKNNHDNTFCDELIAKLLSKIFNKDNATQKLTTD